MNYDPSNVSNLRREYCGVISCGDHIAAFDASKGGSIAAALAATLGEALAEWDDEDGYPSFEVAFGASTPLAIMAAATIYNVGGNISVVEPRWTRLWHCPPSTAQVCKFIADAAGLGRQQAAI
jgi:hypothetical protein